MQNELTLLQSTPLFSGLEAEALTGLLAQIGAVRRSYNRGRSTGAGRRAQPLRGGDPVGMDRGGAPGPRRQPPAHHPDGPRRDLRRRAWAAPACAALSPSSRGAPCEVLLIPYQRLLHPDGSAAQQLVLQNLVRTISDKYFMLARRVDLLLLRSLRGQGLVLPAQ